MLKKFNAQIQVNVVFINEFNFRKNKILIHFFNSCSFQIMQNQFKKYLIMYSSFYHKFRGPNIFNFYTPH